MRTPQQSMGLSEFEYAVILLFTNTNRSHIICIANKFDLKNLTIKKLPRKVPSNESQVQI